MNNPDDFLHLPVDPDEKLSPGTVTFRVLFDALVSSEEFKKSTGIPSLSLSSLKLHQPVEVCARGLISDILRIRFQPPDNEKAESTGSDDGFSCIFKKFATTGLSEEGILNEFRIATHRTECQFYELAAAHIARLAPFRIPRPFVIRTIPDKIIEDQKAILERPVFLVIEDLMWPDKRIGNMPMLRGLNRAQAEAAVVALAQFHAASMTLPREVLEESFNAVEHMCFDGPEFKGDLIGKLCALPGITLFEEEHLLLDKLVEKHFLLTKSAHRRFNIHPVICHGDYWSNNFLFHIEKSGEMPANELDSILDFQCVYAGTGVNDLIRLVFTSVDAELRRTHFHRDWIPLYQRTLAKCLEDHGRPELIAGRELDQIEAELVPFYRCYELIFALMLVVNWLPKIMEGRDQLVDRIVQLFNDMKEHI